MTEFDNTTIETTNTNNNNNSDNTPTDIQRKPFTISGVFDDNNKYIIDKIVVNGKELTDVNITKETTDLTLIKNQIANILSPQQSQGGRRKTSKRKYKNNKRK
jgi:hypothetical protein